MKSEPRSRGIIFSDPMVLAILAGTKTQTRRVIRAATGAFWDHAGYGVRIVDGKTGWFLKDTGEPAPYGPAIRCPYGVPGDKLYVRETWALPGAYDPERHGDLKTRPRIGPVCYGACYTGADGKRRPAFDDGARWRSPRIMPRWASRITLDVVAVRIERLQEITEADAYAEGVEFMGKCATETAIAAFEIPWDCLNAKRGHPWASNPLVWAIEFKVAS